MTHPYDQGCEYLLNRFESADAKAWIEDQSHGPRVIWEFDVDESKYIIGSVYARGASDVLVLGGRRKGVRNRYLDGRGLQG